MENVSVHYANATNSLLSKSRLRGMNGIRKCGTWTQKMCLKTLASRLRQVQTVEVCQPAHLINAAGQDILI